MDDVPGIFRDTFNLYKQHKDKTDWPMWSQGIYEVSGKHPESELCVEILVALTNYMKRREDGEKK
jgi:hypothetical protein